MVLGIVREEIPKHVLVHKGLTYEVRHIHCGHLAVAALDELARCLLARTRSHPNIQHLLCSQVRRYGPSVIAEASYGDGGWGGGDGGPFGSLARYIGVFGSPQNSKVGDMKTPEPIAMTAPVLISAPPPEPIAMTAPVLISPSDSKHTMAFVLPASRYRTVDEAPVPTDPRVRLRQLPERLQAVRTFTWKFSPENAKRNLEELLTDLQQDGWKMPRDDRGEVVWQAAGYNPPFALPFMKRNEVLVNVEEKPGL